MTLFPRARNQTHSMQGNHIAGVATPGSGARQIEMWRGRMEAGAATPPHRHSGEEVVLILSGSGRAEPCAAGSPGHDDARAAYLARLPESAELFSFGDFSLFAISVLSAHFVGGFAQARSLTAAGFADIVAGRA